MKIVLASNNSGKIREFQTLLKPFHLEVVSQAELNVSEIEETGKTFIENSILKARHAAKETGLPALADDSGLVVYALNGAPGIYSARYAGKEANSTNNIKKLLEELKNIPDEKRDAYFYCVLVLMRHDQDPTPIVCEGKWSGKILHTPQGEQGFGYDPVFYVPSKNKSAAQLTSEEKNSMSHRGLALQSLMKRLTERL